MPVRPDHLKRVLGDAQRPVGVKELLRLAGINPGEQTDVKRTLRELLRSGEIEKEGKRFQLPRSQRRAPPVKEGALGAKGAGSGREPGERPRRGGRLEERETRTGARVGRTARAGARDDRRFGTTAAAGFARPQRGYDERGARGRGAPGEGRGGRASDGRGAGGAGARGARGDGERSRGAAARGGRFGRGPREGEDTRIIEGILKVHRDGFGFVDPIDKVGESAFIPPPEAARALDGDRVRVEVPDRPGRVEGRIVEILSRRRQLAVGTYHARGSHAWVEPQDASLPRIRVPPTQMAVHGDLVKVRLGAGEALLGAGAGLVGEVAGSLGKPGEPSAEVLGIAFAHGFSDEFPPEVMDQADAVGLQVTPEETEAEGRRDLRGLALVTIDGPDARDFDDAVFATKLEGGRGWRLVVAIADVTHYVRPRTPLDDEAYSRATSVYLPDRVLPMLPERLSNGICSLRPHEDRLCMVADMEIDLRGRLERYEIYPGVMRSFARCTYDEVQDVLDGKDVPDRMAFKAHFEELKALAEALHQMRIERGAIDFDLPELKAELDEDGHPARMVKRERKFSHRLIEECMLAANEAVAKFFKDNELPSVYRYHGEPDEEKLTAFAQLAEMHGFYLGDRGEISSKDLNTFIASLADHPEKRALNQLLLRSMMQAVYSAENVGHYGLAAEHYLHFTSPIRRYPDLLVHRLLKQHWARGSRPAVDVLEAETERLERMAEHCSERERGAVQTEREVFSYYACLLMEGREGEEFTATIAGVTDFGFFVEIDEEFVEGLVRADTVGPGGRFDQARNALVFPNGLTVKVGQRLRVRLVSVSRERRQIDFAAIAFEDESGELVETQPQPVDHLKRAKQRHGAARGEGPRRGAGGRTQRPGVTERTARRATQSTEVERPRRRGAEPSELQSPPSQRGVEPPEPLPAGRRPLHRATPSELEPRPPPPMRGEAPYGREEEEAPRASPHPGFDRLRALAAKRGQLEAAPSKAPDGPGRKTQERGRGTKPKRGPTSKARSPRGGGAGGSKKRR